MKTTFDLPEELVFRAKSVALARKTTLKSLVQNGLERELQQPSPEPVSPLRQLLDLESGVWTGTPPDAYVEDLRHDWT